MLPMETPKLRNSTERESVAELARGVAHDLHNLLFVVRGNAEMLAQDLPDAPVLQRKLARILRAEQHAFDLSDQLRLYAGGVEARRELRAASAAPAATA